MHACLCSHQGKDVLIGVKGKKEGKRIYSDSSTPVV